MLDEKQVTKIVAGALEAMFPASVQRFERGVARPGDIGLVEELTKIVRHVEVAVRAEI